MGLAQRMVEVHVLRLPTVDSRRMLVQLSRVHSNWSRRPYWHFMTIVLLFGDIHPNPGPTSGCVACVKPVTIETEGVRCDKCDRWCHPSCA